MLNPIRAIARAYGRLVIFAVGLLFGIQVPSLVDQYQKRVDAHWREVSANISGFQSTADLLFEGDLDALVRYYADSRDEVFERDSRSIQGIVDRYRRMSLEREAVTGNMVAVALHILVAADDELLDETLAQYSYTVPLDANAVIWGLSSAVLLILSVDGVWLGCVACVRRVRRRKPVALTPAEPRK